MLTIVTERTGDRSRKAGRQGESDGRPGPGRGEGYRSQWAPLKGKDTNFASTTDVTVGRTEPVATPMAYWMAEKALSIAKKARARVKTKSRNSSCAWPRAGMKGPEVESDGVAHAAVRRGRHRRRTCAAVEERVEITPGAQSLPPRRREKILSAFLFTPPPAPPGPGLDPATEALLAPPGPPPLPPLPVLPPPRPAPGPAAVACAAADGDDDDDGLELEPGTAAAGRARAPSARGLGGF